MSAQPNNKTPDVVVHGSLQQLLLRLERGNLTMKFSHFGIERFLAMNRKSGEPVGGRVGDGCGGTP